MKALLRVGMQTIALTSLRAAKACASWVYTTDFSAQLRAYVLINVGSRWATMGHKTYCRQHTDFTKVHGCRHVCDYACCTYLPLVPAHTMAMATEPETILLGFPNNGVLLLVSALTMSPITCKCVHSPSCISILPGCSGAQLATGAAQSVSPKRHKTVCCLWHS